METQKKRLLISSVLFTIYPIVSLPFYLNESASLENHPVFGALYLYLVLVHSGVFLIGLIIQWLGFGFRKRGFISLATILFSLSGALFFPSLLVIMPLAILNLILNRK